MIEENLITHGQVAVCLQFRHALTSPSAAPCLRFATPGLLA
jgi:hypothetical protein